MSDWNPELYNRFAEARKRPFLDLISLLPPGIGGKLVDLGCGDGANTAVAAEHVGAASVVGVDSSPAMLDKARATGLDASWVEADLREALADAGAAQLLLSNATLQFVDDHEAVVPQLLNAVAPGGWIAVHIPYNHIARTHLLLAAAAESDEFSESFGGFKKAWPQLRPEAYQQMLADAGFEFVSVQVRTYRAPMDGTDKIVDWIRGGAARPYLAALPEDQHDAFLEKYERLIGYAYPPCDAAGTRLLDYTRLFFVGQRPV